MISQETTTYRDRYFVRRCAALALKESPACLPSNSRPSTRSRGRDEAAARDPQIADRGAAGEEGGTARGSAYSRRVRQKHARATGRLRRFLPAPRKPQRPSYQENS